MVTHDPHIAADADRVLFLKDGAIVDEMRLDARNIGTALGLLAGLYLSYVMVLGMRMVFPMANSFPPGGLVVAVAVGLIFGVIAALIPARQAAGMEIVRALRYEQGQAMAMRGAGYAASCHPR